MKNWISYQNNEFSSDASEDILWLIFEKALNKNLSDFTKLMNQASKGYGYSPFEYLGYSLLNDYDEDEVTKDFIVIESGSEFFKMEVNRFMELLKVACDFYCENDGKEFKSLINIRYKKLSLLYDFTKS